ncbi:methyl-accepting chemotaxis protein [Curvibacter sp. APW13]|uniref:methyl-accepting chemotaxis protein n=1 Tax=Curvibacter sp. APW13 TaxID=3077236 RepID=UPI0028DD93AA|nr:methyl-accepting chemotaxis protein [Curvibacter sp. APW13]MDT8990881.1 methyl-accepting chemotaxis protein [Curvibacter sp. APW13]
MRLSNVRIAVRLAFLIGLFLLFLLAVGVLGMQGMRSSNQALEGMYQDRVVPLRQLKVVADEYAVNIVDTAHKVRDGALTSAQGLDNLSSARQRINAEWGAYTNTFLTDDEKALIKRFEGLRKTADASVGVLEGLIRANDKAALAAYTAHDMYPALDPLQSVVGDLIQLQLDVSRDLYTQASDDFSARMLVAASVGGLALVLGTLFGAVITRSITHQMGGEPSHVSTISSHVAAGNLATHVPVRDDDKHSVMAQLKSMQGNLVSIVRDVFEGSESVASAASQIAQGNADLASRTERQAGALQETASAIEELNAVVQQNATNARTANQLAQQATSTANAGGEAVADVVRTMKDINDSSTQILDIIGVIDSIAFQTNLLALNAAVEAARAGEQGRGFAVVAAEVRSLAGRSASAAREIKGLISTSVNRIEQGSALVDRAGQTMSEVVESIQRMADFVGEISKASESQSVSVSQVHEAIAQIDQGTQKNAALVEEIAAAAMSLRSQASALVQSVGVFTLPAQGEQVPVRGVLAQLRSA